MAESSAEALARVQAALDRLAASGMRRTSARGEVLRLLAGSDRHLSGSQIFEQLQVLGSLQDRATVWRTLRSLAEIGVLHVLHQDGSAAYGLADIPHHHAECISCGQVTELAGVVMAQTVTAAEEASGFRLEATGLHLTGTCPECLAGP